MFWPSRSVAASLLDDPSAKRNNHPDLFGDRNEFAGRHQTARRMMPSQQRLAAGYGLGPGINLRLIIEFELPVDDRAPHGVLKKAPLLKPRVHRGLEKTAGVASVRFGAVHRHIGIHQQNVYVGAISWSDRDADAHAKIDLASARMERFDHRVD